MPVLVILIQSEISLVPRQSVSVRIIAGSFWPKVKQHKHPTPLVRFNIRRKKQDRNCDNSRAALKCRTLQCACFE